MTTNKLLCSFRLTGVFFIMLVCTLSANAQFLRTSYFMEGTHYRQQLNPALAPGRGYVNIPVIGAFNASVSSTSLGYQDIVDIIDDNGEFYRNQDFLGRLKDNNTLNLNLNTEILSAGWYKGKNFWSFNVGLRTDIGANLTKNLFTFLNEMDGIEDNWRNSRYDVGGQELHIQAYTEIGLGLSRQINDRLTVGGRVKALLGIGNMQLKLNRVYMNANLPSDARINQLQDQNYLMSNYNTPAKINELKKEFDAYQAQIDLDVALESSFKGLNLVENQDGYIDDFDFESKDMGIAGYGFGIDLGASYKILDNLTVSASVIDLGFMSWKKDATKIASASASDLNMKGSDYTNRIDVNNPNSIMDVVNEFQKDAEGYMDRVTGGDVLDYDLLQMRVGDASENRKSRLAATLVLGAEYGFFNNKLAVGALSTTRFLQPKAMTELTLSANYRPKNYFNLAVSYSMIQSAGKSFGLAVKLGPLFVGTDYMFLGKNSNSVNGFLGISIPLNKRKVNKEG
ncbi:DUF5723 family protein [Bacteroides sp. AN502(2024)]|uniref:DUF5723 family protein n=1 Tax=Bacteroides sp. AN502(2024) TaxID=3160599 RepID=UPI003518C2A4